MGRHDRRPQRLAGSRAVAGRAPEPDRHRGRPSLRWRKTAVSALATGRNREPRLYLAVKLQELYGIPVQAWIQENARPVSKSTRVDSRGPTLIKEAVTEIADNRLNRAAE